MIANQTRSRLRGVRPIGTPNPVQNPAQNAMGGLDGAPPPMQPMQPAGAPAAGLIQAPGVTPPPAPATLVQPPGGLGRARGARTQVQTAAGAPPGMPAGPGAAAARQRVRQVQQPAVPPVGTPPGAPPAPPSTKPDPTDLTTQAFLPGEDPRLGGAQTATDTAGAAIQSAPTYSAAAQGAEGRYRNVLGSGSVNAGPAVNAVDANKYGADQDAALASLGGPNRTELARQALKDFDEGNAEGLQQRYRMVGQNAARLGRLGMGDTGKEAIDVGRAFEQDRMRFANQLARDVSEGDIGDRFRRVDVTSGLRRGEAGIGASLRGEQRGERDYVTGLDERNADRGFRTNAAALDYAGRDAGNDMADRYNRFGAAQSLEDRVFGQGQQNRQEYRGERAYQDARRDNTINNRFRQRQQENDELDARVRRALAMGG